ncbi:MAG: hypothetical protein PV344_03305 [Anaplasma sp.]|nr:hypothetical protein [Anaplasma sp.]
MVAGLAPRCSLMALERERERERERALPELRASPASPFNVIAHVTPKTV